MTAEKGKRRTTFWDAVLLIVLASSLVSCLGLFLKEPTITINKIVVSPRSLAEMSLIIGLEVKNPNRFDLTIKSFEYTVFLNGEEIGTGHLEKELTVPSQAVTDVDVPVAATFKNLGGSLIALISASDLPYKITGRAIVTTALGSRDFTILSEGQINLKH
jgi:LEA14-like dessication related protein